MKRRYFSGKAIYDFYAMYLLSGCESFFSNCMCKGVDIAYAFNRGRFTRKEIASIIIKFNNQENP